MAKQDEKLVALVAKLIELTQESTLRWEVVEANEGSEFGFTKIIGAVFETKYGGRILRIYKREYDNSEDNHLFNTYAYQPTYSIAIELEFVDRKGNSIWSFPRITGIFDLYKAISYKAAGVDDFISDILGDEENASNKRTKSDV
ncbi:MAG: hypothetical protein WD071_16760 [Pseudohongiella sp.]|uniref:hypothetical protein n=1 Tax=Pseudohongiella sp. TaxID=1979412 RepID=UPI0034A03A3F